MTHLLTVLGAAHIDQVIRLESAHLHRTNPGHRETSPGGVAANIARHIARHQPPHQSPQETPAPDAHALRMQFIGVVAKDQDAQVAAHFSSLGVKPRLTVIDGAAPQYTAIINAEGELVIGAACMDLYDAVTIDHLQPYLPKTGSLVLDANFPRDVLEKIAQALPMPLSLYAAGTSMEKVARLAPILPRLDGLVLNRAEAEQITDPASPDVMAAALADKMRPGAFVLVSDGGAPASLSQSGLTVTVTPAPLEQASSDTDGPSLTNVNGAGDAMAAALFRAMLTAPLLGGRSEAQLKNRLQDALDAGRTYAQRSTP